MYMKRKEKDPFISLKINLGKLIGYHHQNSTLYYSNAENKNEMYRIDQKQNENKIEIYLSNNVDAPSFPQIIEGIHEIEYNDLPFKVRVNMRKDMAPGVVIRITKMKLLLNNNNNNNNNNKIGPIN
ncbi:unnamed protein product, partial [marine sediment metagenome]